MKRKSSFLIMTVLMLFAIVLVLSLCLVPAAAFAQAADPGTNAAPAVDNPAPVLTLFKGFEWLLIPIATVAIQFLRKIIPAIPAGLWPWLAPFIGALLDYLGAKMGLWTGNIAIGLSFGALATWFHQLDKQSVDILGKLLPANPPAGPSS